MGKHKSYISSNDESQTNFDECGRTLSIMSMHMEFVNHTSIIEFNRQDISWFPVEFFLV